MTAADPAKAESGMPPLVRQVRWWVLGLIFCVTVINFVDRQSLSIVAPILRESLHLSNTDYGFIVSAFLTGMMVGEFPMGCLMDRFGVRFGLSFAVSWWSLANGLHALARSLLAVQRSSLLARHRGMRQLLRRHEDGVAVVSTAGTRLRDRRLQRRVDDGCGYRATAIGRPHPEVRLARRFSAAQRPGVSLGDRLAVFYHTPEQHPSITPAERAYIQRGRESVEVAPPTNAALLRLRQTWALMGCRLLVGPVVQFYLFWMPEYLYRQRGLSLEADRPLRLGAVPFRGCRAASRAGGWPDG